jgi:hypothetical protein
VKKGFATEHCFKLIANALEQILDASRVADERSRHVQATWRDVTDGSLHIIWDPIHEIGSVLHLIVNLTHRHFSMENSGNCQVTLFERVTSSHRVLRVKHLKK